jgi:multiple sugar transport system substrate-binding protein
MKTHARIKELLAHYDYLPPHERGEVDAHTAHCAECASELAAARLVAPRAETTARPEPALRAQASPSPPPPSIPSEPEPANESEPRQPFPWQRLLLPVGLGLLFMVSIWFGLRDTGQGPSRPVVTPERPAIPGTPQTPSPDEAIETTIIFACDDVGAVYRDYAAIARAFQQENPDIEIVLKSYRDLMGNESLSYTEYMQEIAANADAFCVWNVEPLATLNLLHDLDPLVARDPSFEPGDFYEAVLNVARFADRLYAVPSRFQPALIRYDPKAFDEVGLAYPQPGWTWDDFATAAKVLTKREGGNTQRWGFTEDASVVYNARFRAAFENPMFAAAVTSEDPFASQAVLDLFRWYEGVYVDERSAPVPREIEDPGGAYMPVYVDPRDVSRGRMAMWSDMMYQNARRQGKPAPFPTDGKGGAPVYTSPAWAIAAETLHADAAWRWLTYLSRNPPPDNSQLRLPARRSLVETLPFWQELPTGEVEVYRYILDHLQAHKDSLAPDEQVRTLYRVLGGMVTSRMTLGELLAAGNAPSTASAVPNNIRALTLAVPRDDVDYYRVAAAAYMRATFNTNVQVIARESLSDPTRAENATIWTQLRQVANRADVIAGPGVAALARSGRAEGILLDLTSRVAELPPGRDFYSNTLESLAWRGQLWAVPDRVFVYMIAFNSGIFDQTGAAYPHPGWTWGEFAQAARAVTHASGDKMKWWGFSDGFGGALPLLLSAAGPLVDYRVDPPRPLLDGEHAREAARWYADLWRQGFITVPEARASTGSAAAPRSSAMWVELVTPASLDTLSQNGVSVAPFPVSTGGDATTPIEIENAFAISARSDQSDAAWALIDFLLGYRAPGAPAGASAQSRVAPLAEWGDRETLAAYAYALRHAQRAAPLRREEYFARDGLLEAVTQLAMGESDAKQIMAEAQERTAARIAR